MVELLHGSLYLNWYKEDSDIGRHSGRVIESVKLVWKGRQHVEPKVAVITVLKAMLGARLICTLLVMHPAFFTFLFTFFLLLQDSLKTSHQRRQDNLCDCKAREEIQRLQTGLVDYSALFPSQSNTSLSSEPMGPSSIVTHSTIQFARRIRSFISRAAR